ncbi:RusA family crossover junction endodeoxyribonuclease [Limnobacter sp.]|uniref:RusA family crossover junction endodeoxyribonuclease n=1 Tax=Limnobacter sp. TaxID=2003368 RepID=UPI0025C42ACB|nr:RusA family crossover junction endodeoxyribonuclease [Limnobacter sp.]
MKPILLPYPISANRYWRHYKGMTIRSPEAMKFIRDVKLIAMAEKAQKLDGPVELNIIFHPRLTRRGQASLIRQDLSNTIKVTEDALQGVAYSNDNQIVSLNACISNPIPNGGLTVSWSTFDQIFV